MSDFHFCVILCSVLTKGTMSPKHQIFGSSKTAQEAAASTGLAKNYGRYEQWEKLVVTLLKELLQMVKKIPSTVQKRLQIVSRKK